MKKLVTFSLFLHSFLCVFAGDFLLIGTQENSLGMSSISYQSITTRNPAFYAFQENKAIYVYSQYHFSNVPVLNLTLAYPLKKGKVMQFSCSSFSTDFYKDQQFSFGYGQKIGKKLAFGIALQNQLTQIPFYNSYHTWQLSMGATYLLTDKMNLSFMAKIALLNDVYQTENNQLNLTENELNVGFSYHQEKWEFVTEIQQIVTQAMILKAGIDYFLNENFSCQVGWNSQQRWGFGTQISVNSYKIGTAVNYQHLIGFVPHLSLQYDF